MCSLTGNNDDQKTNGMCYYFFSLIFKKYGEDMRPVTGSSERNRWDDWVPQVKSLMLMG